MTWESWQRTDTLDSWKEMHPPPTWCHWPRLVCEQRPLELQRGPWEGWNKLLQSFWLLWSPLCLKAMDWRQCFPWLSQLENEDTSISLLPFTLILLQKKKMCENFFRKNSRKFILFIFFIISRLVFIFILKSTTWIYHFNHFKCPILMSSKHLKNSPFLIVTILMCQRWSLLVVLTCISFMISDLENLFFFILFYFF